MPGEHLANISEGIRGEGLEPAGPDTPTFAGICCLFVTSLARAYPPVWPRQGGGHWFEPSIAHRLRPVRRSANLAPLSQIRGVCEAKRRKHRLRSRLRTLAWSRGCVRCDRCLGVGSMWDASSVRVPRIRLGEVREVEVERTQHSHDGRQTVRRLTRMCIQTCTHMLSSRA
jgi:hypothetical protein